MGWKIRLVDSVSRDLTTPEHQLLTKSYDTVAVSFLFSELDGEDKLD